MEQPTITCIACGDTGRNSKGGLCVPCVKKGLQPLKDGVLAAIAGVFAKEWKKHKLPTQEDVVEAVEWAYQPRVIYIAGYKRGYGIDTFAGPVKTMKELLNRRPEKCQDGNTPYIVEVTRGKTIAEVPKTRPVARWDGNQWRMKKGGNNGCE